MISGSSVLSALAVYSVVLGAACWLRRRTGFLKRGGVTLLLLLSVFAAVRLFLPIEIPFVHTIDSWTLLGVPAGFFRAYPAATWILTAVWAVGTAIAVGKDMFILHSAHKRSRGYTVVEDETVRKIVRQRSIPCPVVVSPDVEIPYAAGIFRHTIYLPVMDAAEKEIELVLAHEVQHIRTHDAVIKLFFGLVSAAMWWNPIAYWFRREIDALLELRCDAKVTERMDVRGRLEYADMLKNTAQRVVSGRQAPVPALALDESPAVKGANLLKQRVEVLLYRTGRPKLRVYIAASCVMLALFAASYLVLFVPAGAPSAEDLRDDPETRTYYEEGFDGPEQDGEDNSFILKGTDGRYRLFIDHKFSKFLSEEEIALDEYNKYLILEGSAE